MARGSYARRTTETKRDDLRARALSDRPCGDFYESHIVDEEPHGPFVSRKEPPSKSSLWALRMRAIVMEGRRKGLIKEAGAEGDDGGLEE